MNKKLIIISSIIVLIIVVLIGGYFGYQYWKQGTLTYSWQQMQYAVKNQDTTTFDKYFDVDAVWNNYWPRLKAEFDAYASNHPSLLGSSVDIAALDAQEKDFENSFKTGIYNRVVGKSTPDSEIKAVPFTYILSENPAFTINNGTATADFTYQNYAQNNPQNYPIYKFKVILKQQNDRHWKLIDIQGYEDWMGTVIADQIRLNDLQNISTLIVQYLNDGQKPVLDNDNWRSILAGYIVQKNKGITLPDDPLSSYGNKYAFAISNSDSVQKASYVLQAKLSTTGNDIFKKSNYFKNLSYADLISKISSSTNIVLGIDCNPPAYCFTAEGNDSGWSQLLK